jgi:predicted short-subunit dehydrogenase-like oxidoreductase (DUF2520 family)
MKITMIGSGQVATVLGRKILASGHEIMQVYSHTEDHARILASTFSCAYTSLWDELDPSADLFIAAIADHALTEMAQQLRLGNRLIVHTAGSVPMELLKPVSKNYGVLYPLQSLRKELKEIPPLPLLVDGNREDSLTFITDFARSISDDVKQADDTKRLKLHLAAVIVNNFSNHLYTMTEDFCRKEAIEFKLLLPLISETANRLYRISPAEAQTGPAIRNDEKTIQTHLALLEKYPALRAMYETFTRSIETSIK